MSKNSYWPGPWRVAETFFIKDPNRVPVLAIRNKDDLLVAEIRHPEWAGAPANALLIAAAPDLHTAGKDALHIMENGWIPPDKPYEEMTELEYKAFTLGWNAACDAYFTSGTFTKLKAAIAKADGV